MGLVSNRREFFFFWKKVLGRNGLLCLLALACVMRGCVGVGVGEDGGQAEGQQYQDEGGLFISAENRTQFMQWLARLGETQAE